VGETAAFVFGNSGGAVIALDMAKTQPQAICAVVAHEPPVLTLLPDHKKWQRFFAGIYWMACTVGPQLAMLRFAFSLGIPWQVFGKAPRDFGERNQKNQGFFIQHEMLSFVKYRPDIAVIQQNGVKVFLAAGQYTLDKKLYYGRTAPILAEQLGCELVIFPGNHISYLDQPVEWAATLRTLLHKAFDVNLVSQLPRSNV
jgi:pimeloyl-ACP methyl ester carboxylesterase